MGYPVKVEKPVNGFTDIVVQGVDEVSVAIEVETGKSDWRANIKKNIKKGFNLIIVAATNDEALQTIQTAVAAEYPREVSITVLPAWEVIERSRKALLDS